MGCRRRRSHTSHPQTHQRVGNPGCRDALRVARCREVDSTAYRIAGRDQPSMWSWLADYGKAQAPIIPTSEAMQCFDLVLFDTVDSFQPLSRLFLYLGGNAVLTLGGISAVHMPRILVFFGFKQQRPGVRQCKYTNNNLEWPCCQNQTAEQDSTTKTDVSRLGAFRSVPKLTLHRSNSLTSIAKAQMVLWHVDRMLHRKELFEHREHP